MIDTAIIVTLFQNYIMPVVTAVSMAFAYGAQSRSRRPHPMLLAVIGELVAVDVFKANNLINIGVLKPEPETSIDVGALVKALRGG